MTAVLVVLGVTLAHVMLEAFAIRCLFEWHLSAWLAIKQPTWAQAIGLGCLLGLIPAQSMKREESGWMILCFTFGTPVFLLVIAFLAH